MSITNILPLSQEPIPSTITVAQNGQVLETGWAYDEGQSAVVLEAEFAPEEGDVFEVEYQVPGECSGD